MLLYQWQSGLTAPQSFFYCKKAGICHCAGMGTTAKYAAFFDLDCTVLGVSSGAMTVKYLKDRGLFDRRIQAAFLASRVLGGLNPYWAMALLVWLLWRGRSVSETIERDRLICGEYIFPCIRPQAEAEIRRHKRAGGAVVLLSASVDTVCGCIGSHLHLDGVLCTVPEKQGDIYTGRIEGRYCYGREKLARAQSWCSAWGISLADCWYYGDSAADRFVLEAVGNPVCVTPDKRLSRLASQRGWQICRW